jgi:rhodanese-related sulfurtransferase
MARDIQTENKNGASAADYFKAKLSYEMSPYNLNEAIEQKSQAYYIIDCRKPEQFAQGHLPTAINIPLHDLPGKLASIPKDKKIVTYCGSLTCQLAPTAALRLAEKGYTVQELHGGIKTWEEYGFKTEKA